MSRKLTCGCILIIATISTSVCTAQTEPRLFTTPQLRAELERRRLGYAVPEPTLDVVEVIKSVVKDDEELVYALGGTLMRDDGSAVVWLNGEAVEESDLPDNVYLLKPFSWGRLKVVSTENQEYELTPGQVLNLTTGAIFESYQWQEIVRQRQAQASDSTAVEADAATNLDSADKN